MKKVAIDISALDPNFKEHSTRGIGKYARKFVEYLEKNQLVDQVEFFNHAELLEQSTLAKLIDYFPAGRQTLKQQLLYPQRLKSINSAKYLHFLAQTDAPSYSTKPYILTAMDLIPVVCKDLYQSESPNWRYKLARFLELQAIKNAEQIITISECSKQDFVKHLGVDPEKIKVIYLGVDPEYFLEPELGRQQLMQQLDLSELGEYLLYVGGIDPRKNLPELLRIYAELKQIYRDKNNLQNLPKLLLIGQIQNDDQYPKIKRLIESLELESDIIETGYVSEIQLHSLYAYSLGLCFTSLYEGFGLTPLEAMASGTRVFCHKLSALPEVVGDVACYLPVNEDDQSALLIYQSINNEKSMEEAGFLGRAQASKFSWDDTWSETYQLYQQLP